jgi:molecular chaperone DnaK (HSP70)
MDEKRVYGIDLGTTYSCIAYVDDVSGKPVVVTNREGDLTTPSVVLFEDAETRVVGKEAKNTAVLEADRVVDMVKRHMGAPNWRWRFQDRDYSPEEISSYILRRLVDDAEASTGVRPGDVVITCPAYFGISEREATASAGRIAGLNVLEIINEPTAAAISYGLQDDHDQVVVVYDLGGGTFDVTMIEIKGGSITVIATGGDHDLGGRNWDELVVGFLAQEWMRETGSADDPVEDPETLQDLWQRAEDAKRALSSKADTKVMVSHNAQRAGVTLTREKFDELTAPLLERTVQYTRGMLETARELGHPRFDQLLLVGGSTRMPQVAVRLHKELGVEPKLYDPDQTVAKGAAVYGQKLVIGQKIRTEVARVLATEPEKVNLDEVEPALVEQATQAVATNLGMRLPAVERLQSMQVTNVVSHSFGIVIVDVTQPDRPEVISNLILAQERLPAERQSTYATLDDDQRDVDLRIMENTDRSDMVVLDQGVEIGKATLALAPNLPAGSPIEVTFALDQQGRLDITGRDLAPGGGTVQATVETNRALSEEQLEDAILHARGVTVTG